LQLQRQDLNWKEAQIFILYVEVTGKNTCGYFERMWMIPFWKKKALDKKNYGKQEGLACCEDLTAH
jgi:hypothetical protein